MSDNINETYLKPSVAKPKELNIAEILQRKLTESSSSHGSINLRDLLVQRTMARHGFTQEQALALILAFSV